ncbi:zinc-binding dehydrogenase [Caulobacter sp. Root1472]|uniref:zinc-dependent alcohol dehydrogenase n=1 Tax=Caulobacter sp. Root1472 TaxID=1736470 RepID=UPI0006FCF4E4|nr:alcohol dehydrogenase catalytic domain-containing protein [Caulobacter sp. Root1472]KQZ29117.1 molecular chaperone GroES [Caulobacter sp. Root1472]
MKAAVFRGLGQGLGIESVADPTPGFGEVVIKVGRCGICGSDLHMTEDPMFEVPPGMILGHEFAGEIASVGKGVVGLSVGDRVAVPPVRGCGTCPSCLAGEPAWCDQMQLIGGGYGEYALASQRQIVRLPSSATIADGALVEPLAVALHGVVRSGLRPGDKAVVLGAGPIGLATAYWARRMGAAAVVVTDLHRFQEERAMTMGATAFVAGEEDPVAQADRILGGKADVVFECVGAPGLIAQAVEHVGAKGVILVQGLCTRPDSFIPFKALSKECRIQFANFFKTQEYEAALDALSAGAVEPRALITETISLEQLPDTFEALRRRTHQCKVQVAP